MSNLITVKNPKGRSISFSEENHKYFDSKGNVYRSTTDIIHSLFPEFEKDKMAYLVARRRVMKEEGISNTEDAPVNKCMKMKMIVLQEWEDNKNKAGDLGTQIHRYAECKLSGVPFDMQFTESRQEKMSKVLDSFLLELEKHYTFVEAEKIIFSPKILLAGTVDLIMKHKERDCFAVFDWKTSKEISKVDSYGKKGLLFLNHLDNCNYWHFALQLNIYRWILKTEGYGDFDDVDLGVFHINTQKVHGYKIPIMEWETTKIFEYCQGLKKGKI